MLQNKQFRVLLNSKPLLQISRSRKILSAITLANEGSLIINDNEVLEIKPESVSKVIDTTGAGDLFAAGFLYGMTHQKNIQESGRLASIAAAEIISHYGARPLIKLSNLV